MDVKLSYKRDFITCKRSRANQRANLDSWQQAEDTSPQSQPLSHSKQIFWSLVCAPSKIFCAVSQTENIQSGFIFPTPPNSRQISLKCGLCILWSETIYTDWKYGLLIHWLPLGQWRASPQSPPALVLTILREKSSVGTFWIMKTMW